MIKFTATSVIPMQKYRVDIEHTIKHSFEYHVYAKSQGEAIAIAREMCHSGEEENIAAHLKSYEPISESSIDCVDIRVID